MPARLSAERIKVNTVIAPTVSRTNNSSLSLIRRNDGREALLDRIALRLGVALVAWSRRPYVVAPNREELTLRREQHEARLQREAYAQQQYHLLIPRR